MNNGKQLQRIIDSASRKSRWTTALVIAAILSIVLVSSSQNALAQSPHPPTTIAGQVVLQTADVEFPEGVEVVLTIADPDGAILQEVTKKIEPDGMFDFSEVEFNDTDIFTIYIEYGGIARTVEVESLQDPSKMKLDIWETTNSLDAIVVGVQSTAVELLTDQEGVIGVLELIILRNDSDRTFLLPADALILQMPRFGVPKNFRNLRVESSLPSGSVWNGENDFSISNAIPPGEYQIMVSYVVDYVGEALDFSRPMPLGAEVVRFLIPPDMGSVNGSGLSPAPPTNLGGQDYNVYAGAGITKGTEMTITVSGLQDGSPGSSGNLVTTGIPAAIGIAGILLLAYAIFIRKRKRSPLVVASANARGEIVSQIAELDDLHDSGEISDEEHESQRQELVQRAADLPVEQAQQEPQSTSDSDTDESRSDIVAQIAELDERHEAGKINDTEHGLRRQSLIEQATELSDNA